MLNTKLY